METTVKTRKATRRRNGEGSTYRYKNGWRTKLTRGNQTDSLTTEQQQAINRSRILQDLLFHIREAVVITSDQNRPDSANAVMEVSEKIKRDIASLFLAHDLDVPIPKVPFTKDFIVEQLRLITMMLAHIGLASIEHSGFQGERLPSDVRIPKEPFKPERNLPEYMEGAFDHREKYEN